ncbi:hypothetical protein BWQ96_00887 [Gracilariopsis chorda]|uniref:Uncharacterized protein n=1 Tax=Gracilariopsis chorda TaxID=448386 RepID=A0A2V3J4S6_9FLOR|nr:hypothetical protein BWQ96_00887 [Gracilariopsis chorda]|eukprot:PXF49313.1 hypothetical protein BWQ96_00887 [Gracilariopsis chorda]
MASVAVLARHAEQFSAFLALYAQKNNFPVPSISTAPLPFMASTSQPPLNMGSNLLSPEPINNPPCATGTQSNTENVPVPSQSEATDDAEGTN